MIKADVRSQMNNIQQEFMSLLSYKLGKLDQIKDSGNPNDLIESAGLMRDLLLSDRNGLFGEAVKMFPQLKSRKNRKFRFLVKHVGVSTHKKGGQYDFLAQGSSKACIHQSLEGTVAYSRDELLKLPVICIEGGHYTCRDLIQFVANKLGARHFDKLTGTEKQMLLHEIRDEFGVDGFDPILTPLRGKAGVVCSAGNELVERINRLYD